MNKKRSFKMLDGQVVLLAGGAGLIGKVFSKIILNHGGMLVIGDIDHKKAEQVKASLPSSQNEVEIIHLDITSKSSIQSCLNFISNKYGKLDALINNAYPRNKHYGRDFLHIEFEDFCENMNMHLGGYFLISQECCKFFQKQGVGNIINIASIYGIIPPKFEIYEDTDMTMPFEYALIKSAVIHMTKYLAKYFSKQNIRVNAISPGGIFDHQSPQFIDKYNAQCLNKGMLSAEDVAGTLIFLLSDASKYINGQNIIIDDGFSL